MFWQILVSYSKFFMPRPLKWGILGACTIILSKIFIKMLEKSFLWIYQLDGDAQNLQFIKIWNSKGHFEVLNLSKSSLVQKLWYKKQIFPYLVFCKVHEGYQGGLIKINRNISLHILCSRFFSILSPERPLAIRH